MLLKKILLFALLVGTTGFAYCLMNQQNHIPLKVLLGNPTTASPKISPQGTHLSYIKPDGNNVLNVWVKTVDKNDDTMITSDNNKGIRDYFWCQDSQHILYLQDQEGDEKNHIYMTNIATKETIDLTPYEGVKVEAIEHSKFHPNDLVFMMNKDNKFLFDAYKINLQTKKTTLMQKNLGNTLAFAITPNLNIKAVFEAREDGAFLLKVKQNDESWKTEIVWEIEDSYQADVIQFSKDEKTVYTFDSRNRNTGALIAHNLDTGKETVIAEHPTSSITNTLIDSDTLQIQAYQTYTDRAQWNIIDPAIKDDFDTIAKLHRGDFNIVSRSNDQQTWIILFTEDTGPAVWYSYDRKTKEGKKLFYSRPELLKYKLQPMNPIKFTARDGLEIHGYITYPENYQDKKSPLVVNVHGGPWARNRWGYNYEAQFFANRGYICLQVNYRGSLGYGKNFTNAGDKEYGGKMHTDVLDGAEWAKSTGFVDTSKVGIYGGSFGGYAALIGATFTPDYYTCAVDIVGMSDMITSIENVPPYEKAILYNYKKRVGDPFTKEGREFLKSISPLYKADKIKIPMLIAQGGNDPRVPQEQSEKIVAAMKKHNIPHQYVLFPDEGHGFAKPHNRLKFYGILEKFLEEHLQN